MSGSTSASVLLEPLFKADGSCPTLGDPFRDMTETAKLIFDEEGDVRWYVDDWLEQFIHNNPVKPTSDAVKILMAERFASRTKGNYTAIYMWR
jgi:hypothetical protein